MKRSANQQFSGLKQSFRFIQFFFSPLGLIITGGIAALLVIFYTILTVTLLFTSSVSNNHDSVSGGMLSDATLAWEEDVRYEVSNQGLDEKWVRYVLGIIQAESGGDATRIPDIMQASESLGQGMNTITDPLESIRVGVTALSHAILKADELGIEDTKAILQAYNFNTGYLQAMFNAGKSEFEIDFAQEYSRNVVYPAVTGNSPHTARRVKYENPWSLSVEMPWRWFNGGNFHYPNIIYYYISFRGDGTFALPFDSGTFAVTSEFGPRRHPITGEIGRMHRGIDLQVSKTAGAPIRAIATGEVVQATYSGSWGNYIVLDHGIIGENEFGIDSNKKIYSLYAHMNSPSEFSTGFNVEQGDIIGFEGKTGDSTGVHLHLEVIVGDTNTTWNAAPRINPRDILNFDQ